MTDKSPNVNQSQIYPHYPLTPNFPQRIDPQGGLPQSNLPQGNHPQGNRPQDNYPQVNHPQVNHPQENNPQVNHPQDNHPQDNHPQGNHSHSQFNYSGNPPEGNFQPNHTQLNYPPNHPQSNHPQSNQKSPSPHVNIIQPPVNIGYSPYNQLSPNAYGYHPNREYVLPPPGYPGPIMVQPTPVGVEGQWMEIPQSIPNCPPGLEYLTVVDELMVKQKIELSEVLLDFESKNKFSIKNKNGQKVYFAAEDSGFMARNCLGSYRPFQIKVFDNRSKEVIHIRRPASCDSCIFPCCLQTMEIYSPPGTMLGRIEQEWSFMNPRFVIVDPSGEIILRIKGPCCTATFCCGEVEFKILSSDGKTKIGKIAKHWSGLVQEIGTDADNFGISFPLNLDVRMKAVLIGACFLIDIVYYEAASTGPIKCLTCICGCLCSHCKSNT